jgi:sulfur carrier protein ThiS
MLNFTLEDDSSRDVFHALCLDLVSATNPCNTERQAVKESIDRAWSWHRLLKGKRDPRLTENEQQGLMGELHIMSQALRTNDPHAVIDSWKAPEENAKDFIHDSQAIEVKAKRSAHSPTVRITSAEQLDTHDFNCVVLAIVNVAKDNPRGMSIHTYARQLVEHLITKTPTVAALLEQKLVQRGLWPEHDYEGELWSTISVEYFEITTSFPRIESSTLTPGIGSVTYSLDINSIRPFVIQENYALESTYQKGTSHEHQ